ncbi:MAG TPA: CHAP domain-containing protein [Patescibacteria group bacterium]|nr:CHAP domain-containing protein [Patescibacteria group bacterium]
MIGTSISTTSTTAAQRLSPGLRTKPVIKAPSILTNRNISNHRLLKVGIIFANLLLLASVGYIVLSKASTTTQTSTSSIQSSTAVNPLDQVSSSSIALTLARMNNLPETTAIANQAQTAAAKVAMANTSGNVVSKPEVVATALKSKADILGYITKSGDDVANLASKYGITSTSIMWSNGLTSNTLNPGTKIIIPPVNGIVYKVKPGDTADTLAVRYKSNKDQIIAYNDAEIKGLTVGEQIIIPNGTLDTGNTATTTSNISARGFPWGNGPIYGYNGYDYGYCTWYVATQISVPSNWGNASSWAYYARASGWNVSSTPTVGAIAQKGGGLGHVAIVTGVNPDGTVTVRDMNGFAGWGRVGTGTVSTGTFQYITP